MVLYIIENKFRRASVKPNSISFVNFKTEFAESSIRVNKVNIRREKQKNKETYKTPAVNRQAVWENHGGKILNKQKKSKAK